MYTSMLLLGGCLFSPLVVRGTIFTKTLLEPQPAGGGGLCLDGSPAGFYYSEPPSSSDSSPSSSLWVISFEGGGACFDKASCTQRATTNLGSSKAWKDTIQESSSFLDSTATGNPDFYNSHKVRIPYCTGDTHVGQRAVASNATFGFYFSGRLNAAAILQTLLADSTKGPALKQATHVLVTGGSAGGVGAFANVDLIQSVLPSAVVKAVPVAGAFFPGFTPDNSFPQDTPSDWLHWSQGKAGSMFDSDYVSTLWDSYFNPACATHYGAKSYFCGSVSVFYPFIKAPVLFLQNQFDQNQLEVQLGMPKNVSTFTLAQQYMAYYGASVRATWTADYLKKGDGGFLPSCFDHGTGLGVGQAAKTTIKGAVNQTYLVGDWYWGRGQISSYFVADVCKMTDGLPCNPTCDGVGPSDGCAAELAKLGCSSAKSPILCGDCARQKQNERALEKAGCTVPEVTALCQKI